jgi:hypothetical protein
MSARRVVGHPVPMTTADAELRHLRTTLLWAAATGWLGTLGITALSWLLWATASAAAAFFGWLHIAGAEGPDPAGWPALTTALCAALGLVLSGAVAWLIGRSPGLLPAWLAGLVAGMLGTAVALFALDTAFGITAR